MCKEFLFFLVGLMLFFFLIGWGISSAVEHSCYKKAEVMQLNSTWGFWSDCMVETNEGLRPIDSIRATTLQ